MTGRFGGASRSRTFFQCLGGPHPARFVAERATLDCPSGRRLAVILSRVRSSKFSVRSSPRDARRYGAPGPPSRLRRFGAASRNRTSFQYLAGPIPAPLGSSKSGRPSACPSGRRLSVNRSGVRSSQFEVRRAKRGAMARPGPPSRLRRALVVASIERVVENWTKSYIRAPRTDHFLQVQNEGQAAARNIVVLLDGKPLREHTLNHDSRPAAMGSSGRSRGLWSTRARNSAT